MDHFPLAHCWNCVPPTQLNMPSGEQAPERPEPEEGEPVDGVALGAGSEEDVAASVVVGVGVAAALDDEDEGTAALVVSSAAEEVEEAVVADDTTNENVTIGAAEEAGVLDAATELEAGEESELGVETTAEELGLPIELVAAVDEGWLHSVSSRGVIWQLAMLAKAIKATAMVCRVCMVSRAEV
ncbi:hypothetical protein CIB48_g1030 [Xylaria polymorpha]|nr:hypothetical protein CIB48_g1030 [Xylaria polymorpha]